VLKLEAHNGRSTAGRGPKPFGGARKSRGFTLIELLVTLVILLIGIYGMLRIFPRGFTAIEVGQHRTLAAQLAEAEIARWKLHPESLPDAVVATDYDGNLVDASVVNSAATMKSLLVWGELAAVMPGTTNYNTLTLPTPTVGVENIDFYAKSLIYDPLDLTPSQFDAAQAAMPPGATARPNTVHPNWQPNSLYLPRTVIGERIDIRRLGRTILGVPFYLLSHAPLDPLRFEDDPAVPGEDRTLPVYVDIYDAQPWRYAPPTGTLGEREFTIDLVTGTMSFGPSDSPPAEARQFKVDYTKPDTLARVLGLTVSVDAGETTGSPDLPTGINPDTVAVHQRLRQVTNPALLRDEDPDTAQRNIFYVDAETTISGKIQFSEMLQIDPRLTDISVVKVDYRVYDWSILAFDVEVPQAGIVQIPIGRIKGPGYINPPRQPRPQEVARGIRRYYDWDGADTGRGTLDPATWAYVVAVDRQSGEILTDHLGTEWPVNPYERRRRFLVDYTSGQIDFSYEDWEVYQPNSTIDVFDRSGRTYRVFCRGESDWAVQLMITPRRYGRSATGIPGGQPVGAEGGGPVLLTYAWRSDIDPRQIYFPLSEAGQAVAVDYYHLDLDTWDITFIEGEVHTIGEPDVTDLGQWVCRLSTPLELEPYQWGPVGVRGIGVRARAAWVSPGRAMTIQDLVWAVSQSPPTRAVPSLGETWHQVVIDTYLTRAPI